MQTISIYKNVTLYGGLCPFRKSNGFECARDAPETVPPIPHFLSHQIRSFLPIEDHVKHQIACVIGNGGLGDIITCSGMVNYLSTKYNKVIVSVPIKCAKHITEFYKNSNIIIFPINESECNLYEYCQSMIEYSEYDIYAIGNYGAKKIDYTTYSKTYFDGETKRIIENYPCSYYADVNIPFKYAREYLYIHYTPEIDELYGELFSYGVPHTVLHGDGSNILIDPFEFATIDTQNHIIIDVTYNRYRKNHKYYGIAQKFVLLPSIIYYAKLIETANAFYMIDSCIHALASLLDLKNVRVKECFQRESRFSYYRIDITYHTMAFTKNYSKNNIKLQMID